MFRVIIAEAIQHPELGVELYEKGKRPYLERLEAFVRAEAAAGRLRVEDPALAVRQFFGMINDVTFWPRLLVSAIHIEPNERARIVEEAVATFMARHG